VTKEEELKLKKDRKKFDIREEYFVRFHSLSFFAQCTHCKSIQRLSAQPNEDWEPKRIQRPNGLPEWGVPPTEPSKTDSNLWLIPNRIFPFGRFLFYPNCNVFESAAFRIINASKFIAHIPRSTSLSTQLMCKSPNNVCRCCQLHLDSSWCVCFHRSP